jgi:hypothetical protein
MSEPKPHELIWFIKNKEKGKYRSFMMPIYIHRMSEKQVEISLNKLRQLKQPIIRQHKKEVWEKAFKAQSLFLMQAENDERLYLKEQKNQLVKNKIKLGGMVDKLLKAWKR